MGANFYIRGFAGDDDPGVHIGKRSAAGHYCWDCNLTLRAGGEENVHIGRGDPGEWLEACLQCGGEYVEEDLENSSAGVELGFNKSGPVKKKGIKSCSSFSWAQIPKEFWVNIGEAPACCPTGNSEFDDKKNVIEDEYGRLFTLEEFKEMLEGCPIQFTHSMGKRFS